jgi:hypothetical protein
MMRTLTSRNCTLAGLAKHSLLAVAFLIKQVRRLHKRRPKSLDHTSGSLDFAPFEAVTLEDVRQFPI